MDIYASKSASGCTIAAPKQNTLMVATNDAIMLADDINAQATRIRARLFNAGDDSACAPTNPAGFCATSDVDRVLNTLKDTVSILAEVENRLG